MREYDFPRVSRTLGPMFRHHAPARHEGGLVHQIVVIIGISVLSGALIAGLALPWVGLVSKGAENSADAVKNFPKKLVFKPLNERTRVLAADGSELASFYDENRKYVTLDQVSEVMQHSIIAIEDARFYDHGALDVRGTLRALFINQASDQVVQGGSSITQQLVKLTLQENATSDQQRAAASAKDYARKFDELRYAVWVEDHLDQAADPRALPQHGVLRRRRLRHRGRRAPLLQHHRGAAHADPGRPARRHREEPVGLRPDQQPAVTRRTAATRSSPRCSTSTSSAPSAGQAGDQVQPQPAPHQQQQRLREHAGPVLLRLPPAATCSTTRRSARPPRSASTQVYGGGLTIQTTVDLALPARGRQRRHERRLPARPGRRGLAMVEPGTGYVRALAQSRPMGNNASARSDLPELHRPRRATATPPASRPDRPSSSSCSRRRSPRASR